MRCPICEGREVSRFYRTQFSATPYFYRCNACGYCFVWPRPERSYSEQQGDATDAHKNEVLSWDYYSKIHNFLPQKGRFRFLEVGASTGYFSKLIEDRCDAEVISIEMDVKAACYAETRLDLVVYAEPFESFRSDQSFDVIFSGHVIEHVFDRFEYLRKCSDLLSEKGVLIFLTPNADAWKQIMLHDEWGGVPNGDTHNFFQENQLLIFWRNWGWPLVPMRR
ncbi:MAG: hypothetical protein B9S32_02350 [Verrucomicrobia bacterium Tous-C9LFEB]|nr:MAG: hypothetical protein B9S32_02350 [Verrucomicrobia bacterium Tous-C9LFEB]